MSWANLFVLRCLLTAAVAIATHKKEQLDRFGGEKYTGKGREVAVGCFEGRSDVVSDALRLSYEGKLMALADSRADSGGFGTDRIDKGAGFPGGGRGGSLSAGLPPIPKTGNDESITQNKGDLS